MFARLLRIVALGAILSVLAVRAEAVPVTIDFDALAEFDSVGTLFPGLTFTGAMVLTAGTSLNELDFPPRSGANVVADDGGPISIVFDSPVLSVSGYFTYVAPLTLQAFDAADNLLGEATSLLAANDGSSARPSPNELLAFFSLNGISRLTITGDVAGGSFVLDDFTYDQEATPAGVPEPSVFTLLASGLMVACLRGRRCRSAVDNRS